jgi:ribosomal protein L11 methylase PrmA
MGHRVEVTSRALGEIEGPFDVVVANVGRAAVVELAPELVRLVSPSGWLAVSGFSPTQSSLVAGFLGPLVVVDGRTEGEWAAVVLAAVAPDG